MRKPFLVPIAVALSLTFSCTALASTGSKSVDLHYNNIKVMVNGKNITTNSEPFTINGTTYLPLRDISTALGFEVNWDASNSAINLTSPIQIDRTVEKQDSGSDIERYLFSKYAVLNGVSFNNFTVSEFKEGNKHELNVDIELDLSTNQRLWKELQDKQIENWLSMIADDLQTSFNDKDALVQGKVYRKNMTDVLLDFTKDGDESLKVRFYDGSFRDGVPAPSKLAIEEEYLTKLFKVEDLPFRVTSVKYSENINTIVISLNATESGASISWSNLKNADINNAAKELGQLINQDFIKETNTKLDKVYIQFKDKNSKLLKSLEYYVFSDRVN
ncbi:MAG: copper amine oxidase N-terminal domain-containing protein [Firmicutes bacterium]|nr:copper amine oxidase N-terminal domain-containing protein [Bacillota bacterium]